MTYSRRSAWRRLAPVWLLLIPSHLSAGGGEEFLVQVGHTTAVTSVAMSADNLHVVSGDEGGTVKVWSVATGRLIRVVAGHDSSVNALAVSPDAKRLLSGARRCVKLWDLASGHEIRAFPGRAFAATSVAFSPDARYALAGGHGQLKLWSVEDGSLVQRYRGHSDTVTELAFSPDGRHIVSADHGDLAILWETESARKLETYRHPTLRIRAVSFSADGDVALLGYERLILEYDMLTGETSEWRIDDASELLFASDSGHYAAFVGTGLKIGRFAAPREPAERVGDPVAYLRDAALSRDGRFVVTGSADRSVLVWDLEARETRNLSAPVEPVERIAISPAGRYVAAARSWYGGVSVWDVTSGRRVLTVGGLGDNDRALAFSGDGTTLHFGGRRLETWNVPTGRRTLARDLPLEVLGRSWVVAYSSDGRYLMAGTSRGFELWDAGAARKVRELFDEDDDTVVTSLAMSRNNAHAVSGHESGLVKTWDVATGELVAGFEDGGDVTSVAIASDGLSAFSGHVGGQIRHWDVSEQTVSHTWGEHDGAVDSLQLAGDGRTLLSASRDRTVKLWQAGQDTSVRTFVGHTGRVSQAVLSQDRRLVVSGSMDGSVRMWERRTGRPLVELVTFADGEWAALTGRGYFNASEGARGHVNVRVGGEVRRAQELGRYFDPSAVAAILDEGSPYRPAEVTVAAADRTPPEIRNLEVSPALTNRSFARAQRVVPVAATTGRVVVTGEVYDESGMSEVRVRGLQVGFDDRGRFSSEVRLVVGVNEVGIEAFDVHGNKSEAALTIERPALDPPEPSDRESIAWLPAGLEDHRFYALVIGNDSYEELEDLRSAAHDATEVEKLLRQEYGFETRLLLDADREEILLALNSYRDALGEEASLLIYYAGHGYYDREIDRAFWLPVDARRRDNTRWIGSEDVTSTLRGVAARHVLVVADSCYSGVLLRQRGGDVRPGESVERKYYLEKLLRSTSRHVMASGGDEPVVDDAGDGHSVFARAFLRGLRRMDRRVFTAGELFYGFVREAVAGSSAQTPVFDPIRNSNHESGDFVFYRMSTRIRVEALDAADQE